MGGFLNEAGDIASDIALYAPSAFVSPFTAPQVALVLSLAIARELAGVCSEWVGTGHRCEEPLGKADRAIAFGAIHLWIVVQGPLPGVASILMPTFAALALLTFTNRYRYAVHECRTLP